MNGARAGEIADKFALGAVNAPPRYVTRGAMGEIWRLGTDRGTWAVKCLFDWEPPAEVPADFPVQEAASRAGVRLPRPVLTLSGDAVSAVGPSLVRVYEWLELAPAVTVPVGVERAAEVGRILGTIHGLGLPAVGSVAPWYFTAPPPPVWEALIQQAKDAGAVWADALAAQSALLRELGEFVASATCGLPIVCHRDFGPDNVLPLVADDTLAVLDWENAGPLHADGELANALLSWTAGAGHVSAEAALALLEAYRAGGGSQLSLSRASFNVAAATQLNFLKVMADQTLVESKHTAFALEMVNGLLDGSFERLRTYIAQLVSALDLPPA